MEMRRMYGGYFKGFRNASGLRAELMQRETRESVLEALMNFSQDEPEIRVPVTPGVSTQNARAIKPLRLSA
jgi:hypothetical protein